ncbi:protein Shroom2 isoform X3 [Octopus sinensis]|uniref:Protein Shroom2 isoform X3 n=1 Tax=Octopus sinensis TaxID=2607531 RepID=A0A7E6FL70_9MOLL|nr:protein Shroom2 isoform X3 [Octopus sinensis]
MDRRSGGNNNSNENNHIGYRNYVNEPKCSCYLTGQEGYNKKHCSNCDRGYGLTKAARNIYGLTSANTRLVLSSPKHKVWSVSSVKSNEIKPEFAWPYEEKSKSYSDLSKLQFKSLTNEQVDRLSVSDHHKWLKRSKNYQETWQQPDLTSDYRGESKKDYNTEENSTFRDKVLFFNRDKLLFFNRDKQFKSNEIRRNVDKNLPNDYMDSNYPLKKHNLKNSDLRPKSESQESVRVPEDRRHSDEVPYTLTQLQSKAFEFGLKRGFSQNPSTVQSYESLNSENSDFEFSVEETGHEKSPSWPVTVHSKIPCEPYTIAVSKQSQTWSSSTPMLAEHKSLSSAKQGNTPLFQKRDTENTPDDSYAGNKHYHKPKSSMRFKEFYNSKPGYPPPRFDSDGHNLGDAEYNVPSPPERDIPVPKMMSSATEKTSNKTMLSHSQQTSPISPLIMNWPQLSSSSSNLHRDTQTSLPEEEQKKRFSTSEDEKDNSMKPRSETDSKIYGNLVTNPIMISGEKYAANNNFKLGDVKSTTGSSSTYIIKQTPYYNTSTQTELVFPNTQELSNTGRNTELSKMKSAGVQVGLEKDFSHENSLQTAPLADSKDSDFNSTQSKVVQSTGLQASVEGDLNVNYSRAYQPMRRPPSESLTDHVRNQASLLEEKRDQVSDMKFNLESNKQPKQRSASESEVRRPITVENLLSGYQDYVPSTAPILRKLSEEFYMQAFRQGTIPPISTSSSNLSASQETLTQGLKHADSNSSLVIKVSQPESTTSSRPNFFSFPNQSSTSWETQKHYPVSANQHFNSQATTPFFESKEDQSLECQPNQSYPLPKKEKIPNSYKQQNSAANYTSDTSNANRTSSTLQDLGMPEKFRAQVTSYAVPQKTQDLYALSTTPLPLMHESSASTKLDASKFKKFHSSTSVLDSKKSAYGQDRSSFPGSQSSIFRKHNEDKNPSASNQSGEQISSQITATRRASMKKAYGMYDETEAALSERPLINYKQYPFESKDLLEISENDTKFEPKWDHVPRRPRVREGLNEMGQSMQGEGLSNSSHNTQAATSIVHGRSDSLPLSVKLGDEDKFAVPQGPAPKKAYQSSVANQRNMNRTISETMYPLRSYTSNLDVTSSQTQEMSAKATLEDGWNPQQLINPQSDSYDRLKNSRRRSYTSNDNVFKKSIFTAPLNPRLYGDFQHVTHSKQDWQQQQNDNNNNTSNNSNNINNNNSTTNTQSDYMDMSGRHQERTKHQTEWTRVRSQMSDSNRGLYGSVSFDKIKDLSSPESSLSSSQKITNLEKKQSLLSSSLSSVPIYQNVAEKSAPTDVKFDGDLDMPPALPPRIYRLSSVEALTMNNSKNANTDSEDKSYGKQPNLSASLSGHFLRKQMYAEQVRAQAKRFSEQAKGMYIVKTTPKIGIAEQTKVVTWADEPQIAVPAKPLDKDGDQSPKHHFSPEIAADVTTEPEYPRDTYASYRSKQSHRSVGVYKRSKSTLDNSLLTDQDDDEKIRNNNAFAWKSEDNLGHVGFQSRASSEQCLAGIDQVSDQLYLHLSSSTVSLPTDAESAERTDPFVSKGEENSDSQVSVKQRVKKFEVTKPETKAKQQKEERVKPCPPPVPAKPRSLLLRTSSEISAERKNSLPGQLLPSEDSDSLGLRGQHHVLGDFSKPSSDSGVSLESNISPLIHQKLSRNQNQFPPKPKAIATCDHSMGQASGDTPPTKCWDGGTENQQSSYLNTTSESRYFPSKQSMVTDFPTSVESQPNKVTLSSNINPESRLSYLKQKDTKQNSRPVLQEKPSMSFATPVHLDSHFSHNQSEHQAPEKSANSVKIVSNTAETVSKCQPVYNAIHMQDSQNNNFLKEQAAVSLPQSEVSNNQDSSRVVVTSSLRRDSSDANSQQIQKSEQIQNESSPHKVAVSNNININNNTNSANVNNNNDTNIGGKSSTSDSETKKEYKISSHSRQPSQEELEFEIKAKELSQELKEDDKNLLQVLNPNNKKAIDFVEDLLENAAYDCQQIPTKLPKESSNTSLNESSPGSNTANSQSGSQFQVISDSYKESEKCQETDEDALLQKKEGLRVSIMKKLDVLREAKQSVEREILEINSLGEKIVNNLDESCPNSQEKNKYKSFLEDREMVIKLLLKLSVLLARAENSVQCLPAGVEARKKELAIEKRDKLSRQHEEAKQLKSDIDRRQEQISNILKQYLSDEDLKDYHYYLSMKSRLIIESQELEDKIFLGQEQLSALKRSIPSSFQS